ncbi:MAG: UDP-N-acetylmuramoyl-L-alanyl-D-glutamate--2,6-diaminopimelate ligase [Candidatus Nealsonbacteria bacterium]|nr:UDP-N-acetylmuramoyl-L-alanyl-D-glutamate--2,6-diaminopimelate ligase [Candidatus Nealsonbacteria bacterium]
MKGLLYQIKSIAKRFLPSFLISGYHFTLAFIAALFYRFPGQKIKVIGVTGTNGKSSVVEMISRILIEAGYPTASLSSIRFQIGDQVEINDKRMTMPGRFFVQRFLSRAIRAGCRYLVLEVTSEGIKQHRHRFITFDAVVFTNLSPEHIESHGGFENYRRAKGELFKATSKIHIVNLDDENSEFFLQFPAKEKWGYGLKISSNPGLRTVRAGRVEILVDGSRFIIDGQEFRLKLLGEFNIYNALAAVSLARSQGIGLDVCQRALDKVEGLPGRLEKVITSPFTAFVDYAFTPNALEKVYRVASTHRQSSAQKLVCILGSCGGGRDKWKRPVLGRIAGQHCQEIILTNEDPYDEDPQAIIDQIAAGVELGQRQPTVYSGDDISGKPACYKVIDRRSAINKGLSLTQPGDVMIITGKGCEPSMCLAGGQRILWDDRKVVREEYEKLRNNHGESKRLS